MKKFGSADPGLENYFTAHAGGVSSLCFNPSGKQIATVGQDGQLKVWNFKPQTRAYVYPDVKNNCSCVRFSPNGLLIAYSADKEVVLRTPTVKSLCRSFVAHQAAVQCLDFSLNGEYLVTGANDKIIKVWQINDNTEQFSCSLRGHRNWVRSVKFSPDGRLISSASDDCTVKVWDMNSRTAVHTFSDCRSAVLCVEFHPLGFYIAAGGVDNQVRLWDLRMLRLVQVYSEHSDGVTATSFHNSGFFLGTSSLDNTVKLYDLADGRVLYTLHGHNTGVTCAQFSKQGDRVASGDVKGKVLLWSTKLVNAETSLSSPVEMPLADRFSFASTTAKTSAWTETHPAPGPNLNCTDEDRVPLPMPKTLPPKLSVSCQTVPNGSVADADVCSTLKTAVKDITQQLTLLTETISLLEKRLSRAERRIQDVVERRTFTKESHDGGN